MTALRVCPVCATPTPAAVCPNHGGRVIPTFTLAQLERRYRRYEAGGRNIAAAIRALREAERKR